MQNVGGKNKKTYARDAQHYCIGIDEAGRGPLAGSVYAGAVMLPASYRALFKKTNAPKKLADSKKLSPSQREAWFAWMKKNGIAYGHGAVSSSRIDRMNIARASDMAAQRAFEQLRSRRVITAAQVVADGGLSVRVSEGFSFKHFPKADERVVAVSLASIVAKVLRDRYMRRMHSMYPDYGFDIHKGYGTRMHYIALRRYGPSLIHRLTFLGSLRTMEQKERGSNR